MWKPLKIKNPLVEMLIILLICSIQTICGFFGILALNLSANLTLFLVVFYLFTVWLFDAFWLDKRLFLRPWS